MEICRAFGKRNSLERCHLRAESSDFSPSSKKDFALFTPVENDSPATDSGTRSVWFFYGFVVSRWQLLCLNPQKVQPSRFLG